MRVVPAVCHVMCSLSGDHALCGSYRQYQGRIQDFLGEGASQAEMTDVQS